MNPVFKKSDFCICHVPVPKGYPQSQTHVSVFFYDGKYYLTTSPFPNPIVPIWKYYLQSILRKLTKGYLYKKYVGEDFENPCIYVQDDNEILPRRFKLLIGSPLMQKPEDKYGLGSFCSDPDLFVKDDIFYILNRTSFRKAWSGSLIERYDTNSHLIIGRPNGLRFEITSIEPLFKEQDASPCLTFYNGKYRYISIQSNSYNTGESCEHIYIRSSDDVREGWSGKKDVLVKTNGYEPWHMSVFNYKGSLYGIIACVKKGEKFRCWQMLGEFSSDLSELFIYEKPLTDYSSYRSSAIVRNDTFILYNSTVHERIKGGRSIDGREIVVASMDFVKLLKIIKG